MTSNSDRYSRNSRRADAAALWATALFPSFATWLYFIVLSRHPSALMQTAYAAEKIVQFGFPIAWVLLVQRQRIRFVKPSWAGVAEGLLLGITVLSGMLLLYFLWLKPGGYLMATVEPMREKAIGLGMGSPARFILGGILLSTVHSLMEEYYWRWFLFGNMRRFMPVAAAVGLSSLAFAAHHVILLAVYFGGLSLATVFFSLSVAVGGAAWAWIYQRSGSLLGPWLSHLLIDAGTFIVGYDLLWR
jgi:membrane protease YdiL (CAAX protease family)